MWNLLYYVLLSQLKHDRQIGVTVVTFWENQSGGRPGSAKGLMARLTDTLFESGKALCKSNIR